MDNPHDTEARLTNLEIKASFAEDMVDELNRTILRRQVIVGVASTQLTAKARAEVDWLLTLEPGETLTLISRGRTSTGIQRRQPGTA